MRGVNRVMLIGNLGRDPELKATPSGQVLARFSIATTETWKNPQGEKQSKTEWHNIVAWGNLATICEKYLKKGKEIALDGRITYRNWEDKNGTKHTTTEIIANEILMIGDKKE